MKTYKTYMILFFVMIAWGLNVAATKILVSNFQPVTITGIRVLTAGLTVFLLLFLIKKVRWLTKKEFWYVFVASLFNVVAHHYYLSIGLTGTTATNAGLITGTSPLLTTILAILFIGAPLTILRAIGLLIGFTGVSFIVLEGGEVTGVSFGDAYVLLSVLTQAISFILIKRVAHTLDPRLMTGYMMVIGSLFLIVIGLFQEPNGFAGVVENSTVSLWLIYFASACIATAVGHMLYNEAIGKIGASEASIFINLNPFFALVGGFLFLNEQIGFQHILGFLFIITGVLLGSGAVEEIRARRLRRKDAA
ncbi:DMT family transporter [Fictibacillus phosphorivorans]|uniref:DMT family transporter n=1 Tax=Fictibacillus phosphorivorans TaxID=1221500 RepID=UPI002040E667|nr:DMT family transporter [Fictibacillus phosphorivorans]MCM3718328.1 DMT family transporter [Fictibacillus phosphorivorans]MCM3775952.1 DMT family transporter [Fictibacillus phosphorivorans]